MNKKLRLFIYLAALIVHLVLIFFVVLPGGVLKEETEITSRTIRLVNIDMLETITPQEIITETVRTEELIAYEHNSRDIIDFIAEHFIVIQNEEYNQDLLEQKSLSIMENLIVNEQEYFSPNLLTERPILPFDAIRDRIVYPSRARQFNIEGRAVLALYLDINGNITNMDVILEEPQGWGFGNAAINAFTGIRALNSARIDGRAVPVRLEIPVDFQLN